VTQHHRFLRPLYAGEKWCQLFSEPGAGSDLASLAARAQRDGEGWVINGQKVWSTLAHEARWGLLIARTDPDLPKHQGLTYFICGMDAAGVEVRALRQITGDAEFNEVYLTDVRLGDDLRLGGIGEGWRVAMTTLLHERLAVTGGRRSTRGAGVIDEAVRLYAEHGGTDPVRRDELMRLWVDAEVLRLAKMRAADLRRQGRPGAEAPMFKVAWARLNQRITEYCLRTAGPDATLYPLGYERPAADADPAADIRYRFLRTRANSIEGGTSEVVRYTVAERGLGLPAEPRSDKDTPWRLTARS
jgi:alkylation response protein AidB-like acyl-CoA dehydrogenase